MTELEKKMLISKDEYEYLMEHFGCENPLIQKTIIKQVNYYFDTDDLSMNRQNTTCRIRLKDGKYKATMKHHWQGSDHSTETEMEIYDGLDSNAFTDMGLKLQGSLSTDRCIILKVFNCEVALDKNMYLGHEDYELEIEYAPKHEQDATSILRIFKDMLLKRKCFLADQESFSEQSSVQNKSNRFFERKTAIEQESKGVNEARNSSIAKCKVEAPQTDTTSSSNSIDRFDYSDPDDYLNDYFGSFMPAESVCLSCVHFTGASCELPYGSCEYEHY